MGRLGYVGEDEGDGFGRSRRTREDYDISNERVHQIIDESVGMTFGQVAARALELGAVYGSSTCQRSSLNGLKYPSLDLLVRLSWGFSTTLDMKVILQASQLAALK